MRLKKQLLLPLLFALLTSFSKEVTSSEPPVVNGTQWESFAGKISCASGNTITAVKAIGDKVYVGVNTAKPNTFKTNAKLYLFSTTDNTCVDETQHFVTTNEDVITNIAYDADKKQLWISTNGNTPDCYDLNFQLIKRYSNTSVISTDDATREFVASRGKVVSQLELIQNASIQSVDYNKSVALLSFFKGSTYLYFSLLKNRLFYINPETRVHLLRL